jgi:hypothetical protein
VNPARWASAREHARAASEVQDAGVRREGHAVEVGIAKLAERFVVGTVFEAIDQPLDGCVVLLVYRFEDIPRAHAPSFYHPVTIAAGRQESQEHPSYGIADACPGPRPGVTLVEMRDFTYGFRRPPH